MSVYEPGGVAVKADGAVQIVTLADGPFARPELLAPAKVGAVVLTSGYLTRVVHVATGQTLSGQGRNP